MRSQAELGNEKDYYYALTLLALTMILAAASAVVAQPKRPKGRPPELERDVPRKYVPFEIDPNYQSLLKNKLQLQQQLSSMKTLFEKIQADPQKFKLDPQMLKDLKLEDPQMRRLIKDWANQDPDMKKSIDEWLKRNPQGKPTPQALEFKKSLQSIFDQPQKKDAPPWVSKELPPLPKKAIDLPKPKDDPLAKLAERVLKDAQQSKVGDWLRDSPAFRDALTDLQASINNPKVSDWDLGDLTNRLGVPNEKAWKIGEDFLIRMRNMPRPKMDGLKVDFKMPAMGQLPGAPNINAPSMPNLGAPSLPTLSAGLTWLLFVVLFMLVGWQLYRWAKRTAAANAEGVQLGPWPVRPEAVATRAELVKAFDYLALLTLGLHVKCWNHHAVALRWSEKLPAVAAALARLYERARYTDTADQMPDTERDEARQALAQLAEAF